MYQYYPSGLPILSTSSVFGLLNIYYVNNRWLLLTYNSTETIPPLGATGTWIWESFDGVHFTVKGLVSSAQLSDNRELVYGNGVYILASYSTAGLYVSSNLTSWTRTVLTPTSHVDIVFDGTRFVVIVGTSTSYLTTDGVTLTPKTGLASGNSTICYGNNTWVVISTGTTYGVWSCQGDITSDPWVQRVVSHNIIGVTLYNMCFNGSTFISLCPFGKVLESTDGITWGFVAQDGKIRPSGGTMPRKLRWSSARGKFIAVVDSYFVSSSNGRSWTFAPTIPSTLMPVNSHIAVDDNGLVLYAYNGQLWKVLW